jgi:hypothetical protein
MVISRLSKIIAICSLLFVGMDATAMLKKIAPLAPNLLGKNFSSTVSFSKSFSPGPFCVKNEDIEKLKEGAKFAHLKFEQDKRTITENTELKKECFNLKREADRRKYLSKKVFEKIKKGKEQDKKTIENLKADLQKQNFESQNKISKFKVMFENYKQNLGPLVNKRIKTIIEKYEAKINGYKNEIAHLINTFTDTDTTDEILNAHTLHKKYDALTISDFKKTTAIEELIEKVQRLYWEIDGLTTEFNEECKRSGESLKKLKRVNDSLEESTKVVREQVKQLKKEKENIEKQLMISKNMYEEKIANLDKKYDLKISNLEKEQTKTAGEFTKKIVQINKEREEERITIALRRKEELDNLNKQLERIATLTGKVLKIDDNKKHTNYVKSIKQAGEEIEKLETTTEEYIRKEKEKKDSENKTQYGWWDTAKPWLFLGMGCVVGCIGTVVTAITAVWYKHTKRGYEKMAPHIERYKKNTLGVPTWFFQRKIINALNARDLPTLKNLLADESKQNLFQDLDGEELAKCTLKRDAKGNDFIEGLSLLFQKGIVNLVDPCIINPVHITLHDGRTTTFSKCNVIYNLFEYVESLAAFDLLIEQYNKLTKETAHYNVTASEKDWLKKPGLDIRELLNRPSNNNQTVLDIFESFDEQKNQWKNQLIEKIKKMGAKPYKDVLASARKYLGICKHAALSHKEIINAMIAEDRKLIIPAIKAKETKPVEQKPEDPKK